MSIPRLLILIFAAGLLGFAGSGCSSEGAQGGGQKAAERVILITCDTLRLDRLGVYGFEGETSPNLDAFARGCVVYDKAYSTAPMTMPAFASMMTGLLPDHTGVLDNHKLIPPEAITIAEALGQSGFATSAVVSNWVLKSREAGKQRGVEQGFSHFDDTMKSSELRRKKVKERLAADTTDAALSWLNKRDADRFFLWVHYQDPHGPYTPPAELVRATQRAGGRSLPLSNRSNTPGNIPFYQVLSNQQNTDFYEDRYEAEIRYFDRELGRLLQALESEDLIDGALVIFTADHGESLGEHGWWFSHGQTLFDELVHVPLLIRFPGQLAGEHMHWQGDYRRSSALVGHVDLFATVMASAGVDEGETHGISLLEPGVGARRFLSQAVWEPSAPKRWLSVTDGRWRWLQNAQGSMLFDLDEDPGELSNLIASEPETADELRQQFDVQLKSVAPLGTRASKATQSKADAEDMRALGYAGEEDDEDVPQEEAGQE